jgi:hypothetical protein
MWRRGPDHISRRNCHLAAEAPAEFDTSEPTTGMTAPFTHKATRPTLAQPLAWRPQAWRYRCARVALCWTVQSPIRIVGGSRSAPTVARWPPALADAKGGAPQFVAEQFKPDEKVAGVGWRRVGVGGYRFEPG